MGKATHAHARYSGNRWSGMDFVRDPLVIQYLKLPSTPASCPTPSQPIQPHILSCESSGGVKTLMGEIPKDCQSGCQGNTTLSIHSDTIHSDCIPFAVQLTLCSLAPFPTFNHWPCLKLSQELPAPSPRFEPSFINIPCCSNHCQNGSLLSYPPFFIILQFDHLHHLEFGVRHGTP